MWGATSLIVPMYASLNISIHAPRVGRDVVLSGIMHHLSISIHAPRVGRDLPRSCTATRCAAFQSTRPVWGATATGRAAGRCTPNFNPRAPCGARQQHQHVTPAYSTNFNPRAPCGARPNLLLRGGQIQVFQSTRPVWGATPLPMHGSGESVISIHAPRVGRDAASGNTSRLAGYFNPRAPCGARRAGHRQPCGALQISIHAPRVGRDRLRTAGRSAGRISIHAPRVGRDGVPREALLLQVNFNPRAPCGARRVAHCFHFLYFQFQSTRPVWGATLCPKWTRRESQFQSTRPVWGATCRCPSRTLLRPNFNPRAPCGARLHRVFPDAHVVEFQSTRPVWGATAIRSWKWLVASFQSTRPVWGATWWKAGYCPHNHRFQSTRPVWGATTYSIEYATHEGFQSTRPVWGATLPVSTLHFASLFQSTRPVWGATGGIAV